MFESAFEHHVGHRSGVRILTPGVRCGKPDQYPLPSSRKAAISDIITALAGDMAVLSCASGSASLITNREQHPVPTGLEVC
jgi:hypothetical protein